MLLLSSLVVMYGKLKIKSVNCKNMMSQANNDTSVGKEGLTINWTLWYKTEEQR